MKNLITKFYLLPMIISNLLEGNKIKPYKLLSRLLAIFGLSMIFSISGWGADGCTPSEFSQNPLVEGSPYTNDGSVSKNDSDTYYFTAPSAGEVTITLTGSGVDNGDVRFTSNMSTCPGTTGANTTETFTLSTDLDFNVYVYDTSNNASGKDYTITVTFTPFAPEINVIGVADGATDTSFGSTLVTSGTIDRTYTIENLDQGDLTLGTVTATGDFSITAQPSATVPSGGSTTFTVRFDPSAEGTRTGTVSFANNDANENPYNFNVSGVGLVPKDYKLTIDSVVVSENAGTADINIRVDPEMQIGDSLEVDWATSDDTAIGGSDYTSSSGTMTITSTSSNNFTIPILDDLIPESQEIFNTTLSNVSMVNNPSNSTVTIATGAGTVTINDNDLIAGTPTLSIADRSLTENGGYMVFTVTLSAVATSDVFFSYATADDTAWSPDDYTVTSGTGVISEGTSSTTISVPIIDDEMAGEVSETFYVVLSNPSVGTQLGDAVAVGTIIDNDTGLTMAIGDAQIAEQDYDISGIVRVYFSMPLPNDINITYHTSDGTATAPDDYEALSQTVTVPLGSTFYDINVMIVGDTAQEVTEEFYITLDSATDGTIAKEQSKVTIFDNDGIGGCSSYVGMMTINEYQNNPNYQDPYHPLANNAGMVPGNYVEIKYLDFLVKQYVNNNWTISVVTKTGNSATKYWNEADLQCPDPRYEIFEMTNSVMTAEGYVVIKDANGNEVDILNIAYDNPMQQCQDFLYDTDFESSAQNKDLFREPDGTGDWFDVGSGANSLGSRCINRDGEGSTALYTEFDAIDTDEPLPLQVINQLSVPIKTKIVNQAFDLNILDINTSTGTLIPTTIDIKAYLADANTFAKLSSTLNVAKDVNFYNQSSVTVSGFEYDKAIKAARLLFEYCEDVNGISTNWNTCWNSNTQADLDKRRISFSRDTFAIRPDKFDANIAADTVFEAGLEENFIFRALDFSDTPTADYNETQNSSFAVDLNVSNGSACPVKNLTISPYVQFADGIHQDNFSFNDIGDINMSIHEIIGDEFAVTDNDDTPDNLRLITEHNVSFRVIPHHFNIDVNLTDHNSDNNLSYLHDMHTFDTEDNYAMGAVLEANISAMHFDDVNITRNYIDTCYAKDTNLTLTLNGTTIIYPSSAASLTQFLYYNPVEDNGNINSGEGNYTLPASVTTAQGNTIYLPTLPIENNASSFPANADGNGTTFIRYKLNFDRKQHLVVNPIQLLLIDTDIVDTDNVVGNDSEDQSATLFFARSRASHFFYDDVIENSVNTPILIDVYCDLGFTACSNLGIDTVFAQTNEYEWWLSLGHQESNNDGNITLEINLPDAITEGENTDTPTVDTDVNVNTQAQDATIDVTSNATVLPMTVEIDYDQTNPTDTNYWLIYNPNHAISAPSPFYKVRFIGTAGWAGHGDTGHVVDSNTSTKKNRRLGW